DKRLDQNAIDAVNQWKFRPAVKEGKPVWATTSLRNNAPKSIPINNPAAIIGKARTAHSTPSRPKAMSKNKEHSREQRQSSSCCCAVGPACHHGDRKSRCDWH